MLVNSREEENQEVRPRPPDAPDGTWRMKQADMDRVRNIANASNASRARTFVMYCGTIKSSRNHWPPLLVSPQRWNHPLDTEDRLPQLNRPAASATVISLNAAQGLSQHYDH
jgi:hypothetical protein